MKRAGALARLTELGFSPQDAQRMVTTNTIDRAVGGTIASGLTSTDHVRVIYQHGKYDVITNQLQGCTCGYCVMTGRAVKPADDS